jgi:peptidoglycan hydrolase CwlO-like protein
MKRASVLRNFLTVLAVMTLGFGPSFSVFGALSDDANQQIQSLQQQIEQYQQQIDTIHSQSTTLKSQIALLTAQINQTTLELKSLGLSINQTTASIKATQAQINAAEAEINQDQTALGQYIRVVYQNDQETLTGILFKHDTLSDFFNDVNSVSTTQDQLRSTIDSIKDLKTSLDGIKQDLENKQNELEKQQAFSQAEKRSLDGNKTKKNTLLKATTLQELDLQQKKQRLQDEIYYLEQNGVTVDDAIKYGNLAAIATGLRPAFLLAELEQESALGNNVGKCYILDGTTGTTRSIVNGHVYTKGIHPTRDLPLFLKITAELGRDPYQTPVSCAQQWGGAMGPAQFIPSTWMGYRDRVSSITGHSPANPWNIQDAFTAAAAKLSKDGANNSSKASEIAASKRYYCGNANSTASGCVNYANSVQRLAAALEQDL